MNTIMSFLNQWLSTAIDIGLILGIFFLWLTWYRNGKRQQQMEQLLAETARQLEEATQHLSIATDAIQQLKQQEHQTAKQPIAAKPVQPKERLESTVNLPPQNSTQATMILRMQREGESPQSIAERLDMPLAQVKLMLKLHAASSSTVSI